MTRNRFADLAGVQHRGRLVHDDESGVVRQGPRHAHDLLAGRGQPTDLATRRDVGVPQPAQQVSGRGPGLPRSGEPGVGVLVAEEDVLRDRESVDQVELLVDGGDADLHRGDRVAEPDRLAAPGDGALVGLVRAGEHLDQGGLPGAVLPEQACTSPGRTSRSTPSSARTPGNTLTMPDMVSSGCAACGAQPWREHRVRDHPRRADHAGLRAQLGQDDRAGCRWPAAATGGRRRCGSRRAADGRARRRPRRRARPCRG